MFNDEIFHIGTETSGRYPKGSGGDPYQHLSSNIYDRIEALKRSGFKGGATEMARALGYSTTEFRAEKSIARAEIMNANINRATELSRQGLTPMSIAREMGAPESSVRGWLASETKKQKIDVNQTVSALESMVAKNKYIDVGAGSEIYMGISATKLKNAVTLLTTGEDPQYIQSKIYIQQAGGGDQNTTVKVLAPKGTTIKELYENSDMITYPTMQRNEDGTYTNKHKPIKTSLDKVAIRYAEDGGTDRDGLILVREGAEGLDLGKSTYAQVRIATGDKYYLKGMCMRDVDGLIPPGHDMLFFTNKTKEKAPNKEDVLKKMDQPDAEDPTLAFGSSVVRQKGALNIVNEEGDWYSWSNKFSTQMLAKQSPQLVKEQLELTLKKKQQEYDEVANLTNPEIKRKLLLGLADDLDSSSVHMKTASIPKTAQHVLLPFTDVKDNEIYAPKYNNGDVGSLVRHPHGGTFEIPTLVVNNNIKGPKKSLGNAVDAVGISAKTAAKLSGADFDGDTALVIPNNTGKIKSTATLKSLQDFDTKSYSIPQDENGNYTKKLISKGHCQKLMGVNTNLLTDMTFIGPSIVPKAELDADIEKVVRHTMVTIDSYKHKLDYRQSEIDNNIKAIKAKYQGGKVATLLTRAGSPVYIDARRPGGVGTSYIINKKTGEKEWVAAPEKFDKNGVPIKRHQEVKQLAITKDARTLISDANTKTEQLYADYSNTLKKMANDARLEYLATPDYKFNAEARNNYQSEIESLKIKLVTARANSPRERQAQIATAAVMKEVRLNNPDMDKKELSKMTSRTLTYKRAEVGAAKEYIDVTPKEWAAIQAGAITKNTLKAIVDNIKDEKLKSLATPKLGLGLNSMQMTRASALLKKGVSLSEIADDLGVSVKTIVDSI